MLRKRNGRDFRLPVRLRIEALPDWLTGRLRRFAVHDPSVIMKPNVPVQQFQRAMFGLHIGGTVKITWSGRQAEGDQLLSEHLPGNARIVEMGASDGSTAVDLIRLLGDRFDSYLITDRYIRLEAAEHRRHRFLFRDGECVVIAGRRLILWPQSSPLLTRLTGGWARRAVPRKEVLLLNPDAKKLIDADDRVGWAEHDVFEPLAEPVEVIKVGNLLRRVYFTDGQIRSALAAIRASLTDEGLLLLCDHLRGNSAGLYRASLGGFVALAIVGQPEIHRIVTEGSLA